MKILRPGPLLALCALAACSETGLTGLPGEDPDKDPTPAPGDDDDRPDLDPPGEAHCRVPMFRMDPQRTGVTDQTIPTSPPTVQWLINTRGVEPASDPVWHHGYRPTEPWQDEDFASELPQDGQSVPATFFAPTPLRCDDVLYVGQHWGAVVGLDPETGEELWRNGHAANGADGDRVRDRAAVNGTPLIREGVIYIPRTDFHVHAVDLHSGELLWKTDTGSDVMSSPLLVDGLVIASNKLGRIVGLDPWDGAIEWDGWMTEAASASPSLNADGTRFLTADRNGLLAAWEVGDDEPVWTHRVDYAVISTPAYADGVWYVGSWDNRLYAFSEDGEELWRFEAGANITSSATIAGDLVVVGSWDWMLYALDRETGEVVWANDLVSDVLAPAITDGRTVLQLSERTRLHAFDLESGDEHWQIEFTEVPTRSVATASMADGWIYVSTMGGDVYGLRPN